MGHGAKIEYSFCICNLNPIGNIRVSRTIYSDLLFLIMKRLLISFFILLGIRCFTIAQAFDNKIDSFRTGSDILITIDRPIPMKPKRPTVLVLYALPNGNSTAQTMGKQMTGISISSISGRKQFLSERNGIRST